MRRPMIFAVLVLLILWEFPVSRWAQIPLGVAAQTQQTQLPNPYRLVEGWPTLPQHMNGGRWGELIKAEAADVAPVGGYGHAERNELATRAEVRWLSLGPHTLLKYVKEN